MLYAGHICRGGLCSQHGFGGHTGFGGHGFGGQTGLGCSQDFGRQESCARSFVLQKMDVAASNDAMTHDFVCVNVFSICLCSILRKNFSQLSCWIKTFSTYTWDRKLNLKIKSTKMNFFGNCKKKTRLSIYYSAWLHFCRFNKRSLEIEFRRYC